MSRKKNNENSLHLPFPPSLSHSLSYSVSHSHWHCLILSRSQWKCGKVAAEKFSDCLGTPSQGGMGGAGGCPGLVSPNVSLGCNLKMKFSHSTFIPAAIHRTSTLTSWNSALQTMQSRYAHNSRHTRTALKRFQIAAEIWWNIMFLSSFLTTFISIH